MCVCWKAGVCICVKKEVQNHFLLKTPLASADRAKFLAVLLCILSVTADHGRNRKWVLEKRLV